MAAQLEKKYRAEYQGQRRDQAALLRTLDRQIERTLTAMTTAAKTLASETDLLAADALETAPQQATMTEALGDKAARAQLQGLSAHRILRLNSKLSDIRDRAKVRLKLKRKR